MPTLAQTLHGYDQGHRLLASGGEVDAREHALLDRLSDLSGYLPSGTSFERYYTGFPCGRYYALACTWLDKAATRAGTVLTHTLLVPLREARTLDDLWVLSRHLRQPLSTADRDAYQQPLTVTTPPAVPMPPQPPEPAAAGAVALLFGQPERPLLWVDVHQPELVARYLWSLLWPEQRERFAFCTLALQLRTVEGRPFDFLSLPPEARGSFLERAGSEAWWDNGRLLSPKLSGLPQQAWAQAILREGAAEPHRLVTWCRDNALPLPEPKDIPILWRFLELAAAASERLSAARSRADLFERLWPRLASSHPLAREVLQQLLTRQPEAVFEPNPLWELTDFLQRRLVRERIAEDPAFALKVEELLAAELERRLAQAPLATLRFLPELLQSPGGARWREPVLHTFRRIVTHSSADGAERLAATLLRTATELRWPGLAEAVLSPLSPPSRRGTLKAAWSAEAMSQEREALSDTVASTAEKLRDAALLFSTWSLRGQPLQGLTLATTLLSEFTDGARQQQLNLLLSEVDAPTRLEWALEASEPWLVPLATSAAARAAHEQGLLVEDFARRCSGKPNGARAFLASVATVARPEALEPVLQQAPELARGIIHLTLRSEPNFHGDSVARQALHVLAPEQLFHQELLDTLQHLQETWKVRDFVQRIGPQWIRAICTTALAPDSLAAWLAIPQLREWLRSTSRWWLFSACHQLNRGACLPPAAAVLQAYRVEDTSADLRMVRALVEPLLEEASAKDAEEATEALVSILRRTASHPDAPPLVSSVLGTVSRTLPPSGFRLVELTFHPVYARVERDAPSWFYRTMSWWRDVKEWDRAKAMRYWLLDTFLTRGWPPASLLRSLEGDVPLFFRLVHRAARSSQGMDLLHRLPEALQEAPDLLAQWKEHVQEALANPYRPVDYE